MYEIQDSKERKLIFISLYVLLEVMFLLVMISLLFKEEDVPSGLFFVSIAALFLLLKIPVVTKKKIKVYPQKNIVYHNGYAEKTIHFSEIKYYKMENKVRLQNVIPADYNSRRKTSIPSTYLVLYDKNDNRLLEIWIGTKNCTKLIKDLRQKGKTNGKNKRHTSAKKQTKEITDLKKSRK